MLGVWVQPKLVSLQSVAVQQQPAGASAVHTQVQRALHPSAAPEQQQLSLERQAGRWHQQAQQQRACWLRRWVDTWRQQPDLRQHP